MTLPATLLASGILALAAAAVYAGVAVATARRAASAADPLPLRLFAGWWASVTLNLALTGVATVAAAFGVRDLPFYVTHALLERLVLSVGLWGLLGYVGFLVTGDRRTWIAAAAFYALYYGTTVVRFAAGAPHALEIHAWARPSLVGAEAGRVWPVIMLGALLLPPLLACAAYFRLYFEARSGRTRRRIVTIAGGIGGWMILSVVAYLVNDQPLLQIANRLAGLGIALAILSALGPATGSPGSDRPMRAGGRDATVEGP